MQDLAGSCTADSLWRMCHAMSNFLGPHRSRGRHYGNLPKSLECRRHTGSDDVMRLYRRDDAL